MALKELERLTRELGEMTELLKDENRPAARLVIIARAQEIIRAIDSETGLRGGGYAIAGEGDKRSTRMVASAERGGISKTG